MTISVSERWQGFISFHDVARDILNYGTGNNQTSGPTVLLADSADFGSLIDEIKQCRTVSYSYNNIALARFHGRRGWGRVSCNDLALETRRG